MFKKLRLRLTLQFVLLSSLVYAGLVGAAIIVFHHGLTEIIDDQLDALTIEASGLTRYDNGRLQFVKPPKRLDAETFRVEPTIQLWDESKRLVQKFGSPGIEVLAPGIVEHPAKGMNVRSMSRPIRRDTVIVGYVQMQLVTAHRDRAEHEFVETALLIAPFVLICLGVCGYFFAGRAIAPVEQTFALQRQFLADAGHELKTPVAIIQAACDNLTEDLRENPQIIERLEVVMRSTERMQKLIADLLLLTKTEQSQARFEVNKVQLDMLVREVVGDLSDLADDKNIKLVADEIQPATVNGDRDALHKALSNLVRNAVRYTNAGGTVTASLTCSTNTVTFKVIDTGIGIPRESLDKIFDRFYRVDQSRSRTQGGSGLGLAIVKALVEKHNGTISVSSEMGKGSTFTMTLPLA